MASGGSSVTFARVTPLTASSADRTAVVQPSHNMPEIVSVVVASFVGFVFRGV